MFRTWFFVALLFTGAAFSLNAQKTQLAATPPMGWNSWDAYGFTIDEKDFKANAEVLASMKQYGWQYAVIDEGWYMQNPFGNDTREQKFLFDANGLLLPDVSRFPSAAGNAGFKPLSDWLHGKGLKFGIHILRGIPKEVVDKDLPIAGSSFRATEAADKQAICGWSDANYGIADNAAGQAYYDSMLKRYAEWGLDFIKVDCISDHPYRITEIRQIAEAIRKTGRPIVLSLSPGPTQLEHAEEVAKYAQMWRITNDHWDAWSFQRHTPDGFPFGLSGDFDVIAAWNKYARPGSWPDADMLPEGYLGPHAGWGEPRQSRFTQDEQRTEFTLWAISRSPMIFGGNLTKLDDFTRGLMTNEDLLEIDQKSVESHPVTGLPKGLEKVRVWEALVDSRPGDDPGFAGYQKKCYALFNLDDQPVSVKISWKELGLKGRQAAANLWDTGNPKSSDGIDITLPAHGSTVYCIKKYISFIHPSRPLF